MPELISSEQIIGELEKIEARHDVAVLYACELGSRGWCFASEDTLHKAGYVRRTVGGRTRALSRGAHQPAVWRQGNEEAFVKAKKKLLDECDLWCVVSLPGGAFTGSGPGLPSART